jgi:hypothetical protein
MECRGVNVNWGEFAQVASNPEADADEVVSLFIQAFDGLLGVNRTLMREFAEESEAGKHLMPFMDVFDTAAENALETLYELPPDTTPSNVATAIRLSALPQELLAFANYVEARSVPLQAKLNAAEEVQDSVKELIKKAWNPWWLDPILKALDEVLNIFRGSKEA